MIECKKLFFSYSNSYLFNDLNAKFEEGHIYGLLGKNGAGKTTLLKCITGLLHLQKGEILVNGKSSDKRSPLILRDIFFFPENLYLPSMKAFDYVKLFKPFYPNFDENYLIDTCKEFEISMDTNLKFLSFGQKKKFILAFGLSTYSKIILLDEPTNGLDIPSKVSVRKKIAQSLNDDQIFIISTHQVRDLSQLFDSIIILHNGKIVLNSSIDFINQNFLIINDEQVISENIDRNQILYTEQTPLGDLHLVKKENFSNQVDIEFFFNAVISYPEKFQMQI